MPFPAEIKCAWALLPKANIKSDAKNRTKKFNWQRRHCPMKRAHQKHTEAQKDMRLL
jgi:hypothetical protein